MDLVWVGVHAELPGTQEISEWIVQLTSPLTRNQCRALD